MEGASVALPGELGGALAGPSALEQLLSKGRVRATILMLGPAFVASIAYVDPGNFATNIEGGAQFGYLLLWVVLLANVMAMLIQYLSAKLGIVTDRNYPEVVRERFPRPFTWGMWVQAEIMAMSTDVAEFLGAALGLNLLFGVPLLPAGLMTGVIAFAILELQTHGFRRFELAITGLLGIIFLGFLYETLRIGPSTHGSLRGLLPGLHGVTSLYLAVGIIGATVMPHVIYLHSALTKGRMPCRNDRERGRVLRFERLDVIIALGLAGLVNMAMLAVAAKLFHTPALAGLQLDPGSPCAVRPPSGGHRRARVCGRAARLWRLLIQRRHLRRPSGHARLHQRPHPADAAPRRHDDPCHRCPRSRHEPHPGPRSEPGRAVLRHPIRPRAARHAHRAPRRHGRARQPAPHDHPRLGLRRRNQPAQRLPALPAVLHELTTQGE